MEFPADAGALAPGPRRGRLRPTAGRSRRTSDRLANDTRAELFLGAVACVLFLIIAAMIIYVFRKAWPSFEANGFAWFLNPSNGSIDLQIVDIFNSPATEYVYEIGAWPAIFATILTAGGAGVVGTVFAVLTSIFIVEFAPPGLARLMEPVVRLLAAVPSVVYGLFGLLVLVPFVNDRLISESMRESVAYVVQLNGAGLGVAVLVLTIMIVPIMIAIVTDALRAVPPSWKEGSTALGVNRWRTMTKISVRAARPAIVAALVLGLGRAIGEAIALSMVSGSVGFSPNILDGPLFFLEPLRPLAPLIVENAEGFSVRPFGQTMYAFAAVLLVSTMLLSLGSQIARQSMRKYTTRG